MIKRLLTFCLALTFLGATLLPGEAGVLCFMTETVQSSCCCHKAKQDDEKPQPSVEGICCELQVAESTSLPTTVVDSTVVPTSHTIGQTFSVPELDESLERQTNTIVAEARGPPPREHLFHLNCSYLI